jgi:cofilin
MTYIASFFHAFSSMGMSCYIAITRVSVFMGNADQAETESRRVEKFADLMQSVWIIRTDYERRARLLLENLEEVQNQWAASVFTGVYADAKAQQSKFNTYKQTTKRTWVTERQDVITLFGNVQTKLKTYSLAEYVPPRGLAPSDLDAAWQRLLKSEAQRSRGINAEIRKYVRSFPAVWRFVGPPVDIFLFLASKKILERSLLILLMPSRSGYMTCRWS